MFHNPYISFSYAVYHWINRDCYIVAKPMYTSTLDEAPGARYFDFQSVACGLRDRAASTYLCIFVPIDSRSNDWHPVKLILGELTSIRQRRGNADVATCQQHERQLIRGFLLCFFGPALSTPRQQVRLKFRPTRLRVALVFEMERHIKNWNKLGERG